MSLPVRPSSDFPLSSLDSEHSSPQSKLTTVYDSDLLALPNCPTLQQLSPQSQTASQAQSSLLATNTSIGNGNDVTTGFGVDLELGSSPLSSPISIPPSSASTTNSVTSNKSKVSAGSEHSKASMMSEASMISKISTVSKASKKRSHDDEVDPEVTPPPTKTIKTTTNTTTNITKIKVKPKKPTQKRAPPISPSKPAPEPGFKSTFNITPPPPKAAQVPVQLAQDTQEPVQEPAQKPIKKPAQKPTQKPAATPKKAVSKPAATPPNRPSRIRKAPERLAEQIGAPKPNPIVRKPASKVFDPEYVTTNANSRLCKADIYHMLLDPLAWDSLTTPQRASLIAMLNPSSTSFRALQDLTAGKITELKRPRELTVNFNIFRTDVAKFKEDLGNGYLGKTWQASAEEAVKDRAAGVFDDWKEEEAERWWGQKSVGKML